MSPRRLLVVTCTIAIAGCGNGLPGARTPAIAPPAIGAGWQQIPLSDLESRPVTLAEVRAGRPALVNLWAPWCERCKVEFPALDRLSRRLDGCGVIVGVAVGEDAPHTAAFVHQHGLSYPQVVDERFQLADALRQSRVPTTLVLDGEGAIVHVGPAVDEAAIGALEAAVSRQGADGRCRGNRLGLAPTKNRGVPAKFRGHDAAADGSAIRERAEKCSFAVGRS